MRLANPNPPFCSSCFSQQPTKTHIDFEVAWDGPVISHESDLRLQIDDLFLCEDCLKSAAGLLGMVYEDDPDLRERLANVLADSQKLRTENNRLQKEQRAMKKELDSYTTREAVFKKAYEAIEQVAVS